MDAPSQDARDRALYDRIAHQYARKDMVRSSRIPRAYQVWRSVGPVIEKIGPGAVIADIGCGVGQPAHYLEGRYARYIGIDQSEEMIAAARTYNAGRPAEFLVASVKSPDLPVGVADLVLCMGALHHMTELDAVMTAIKRIGRPGGYFVAIEPNNGNPVIQLARSIRMRIDSGYSSDQHFFSRKELTDLLTRNGLLDVEVEYQGFATPPFAQVILPCQPLAVAGSRLAVMIDSALDRVSGGPFGFLSWNIIARARIPESTGSR